MSARLPIPAADDAESSQAVKAQLRLREMILAGELPGGERIAELVLVEKLGVSRTPIRAALTRLEHEGLLQALPNGGYAVRTFSERDGSDAIERREGARAEAIMREHSRIAQRNLREAVQSHNLDRMPGVRLIRNR